TNPVEEGGVVKVQASFENLGGVVPAALAIVIAFDGDKITRVEQRYTPRQAQPTEVIPPGARPLINNARINETPILVAHTDESGARGLTFRGSTKGGTATALSAWTRRGGGGLAGSLAKNPAVSLAYRDGPRAMLLMSGRARIEADEAIRKRVFDMIPES